LSEQLQGSSQEAQGNHIAQAAAEGVATVIDGNNNIVYNLSPAQAREARELRILLDKESVRKL
jgi:DNA-binding GntR family transcriptional regulator